MTTNELDLCNDVIDVRDIIARVEALESAMPENDNDVRNWEHSAEYSQLTDILEDLQGNGGDEQWRGDWYPVTLVSENYFSKYAQELAEECGMIDHRATWPTRCIDWEQAAEELKTDYTSTQIDGSTYFYR